MKSYTLMIRGGIADRSWTTALREPDDESARREAERILESSRIASGAVSATLWDDEHAVFSWDLSRVTLAELRSERR